LAVPELNEVYASATVRTRSSLYDRGGKPRQMLIAMILWAGRLERKEGVGEPAALRRIWPSGDRQSGLIDVWNL
jgi:hypothetical protein